MKPFFSVIITTYNRPKKIIRTIKSIIEQSFKDFELIIVNDGSTDDYNEVERYIEGHNNIIYHFQNNTHLSGARNKGVNLSNGRYINFIDDDDYHLSNHLLILHKEIIKQGEKVGIYHTYPKILNSRGLNNVVIKPRVNNVNNHEYYITDGIMTVNCCCFSKQVLLEFPYDTSFRIAEEHHQRLRAFGKYPVFEIKEFTSVYDKSGENSLTSNKNIVVINNYIDAWQRIFSINEVSKNIRTSIKNRILSNYLKLLINYHRNEISYKRIFGVYRQLFFLDFSKETVEKIIKTLIWKVQSR